MFLDTIECGWFALFFLITVLFTKRTGVVWGNLLRRHRDAKSIEIEI